MKPHSYSKMVQVLARTSFMALALLMSSNAGRGAAAVGSIGPDFTIRNHKTGQPLRLYSFERNIVLLDFWAYWCGPCQSAAADMEPNIVDYYRTNYGNPNGVPVQVMSISVDLSDVTAANNFINTYGLELVGDDTVNAFGVYGNGYIPYMVVLNGTTNSTNFKRWEVRHSQAGYDRAAIRAAINAVQTPAPACAITFPAAGAEVAPGDLVLMANVTTNGKLIKRVEFYNGGVLLGSDTSAPYTWAWANAPLGPKSVTARAYYGTAGWAASPAVAFTVANPQPLGVTLARQGQDLVLSWTGGPGTFQVEMATDLKSPNWQEHGAPTTATSVMLTPGDGPAFYRVKKH